jgi:hypothetical protein
MMHGFNLLGATALVVAASAGCQPEVVIASSEPETAGTGGSATAGTSTGGAGAGGTGGTGGTGEVLPSAGEGGAVVMPEPPRLLADSVADFSFMQGDHGWQYGYDSGTLESFTLMTHPDRLVTAYVPPSNDVWKGWASDTAHWTQIFQLGAHPNGTISSMPANSILERAVRRWTSTYAGEVTISGEIAKIDLVGSNGVDAFIYVDGKEVYKTFIAGDDGGGRSYEVRKMLKIDSNVDFVLDPHEGDDHHDLSRFTGIIVRVEQLP